MYLEKVPEILLFRVILIVASVALPLFGFLAINTIPHAIEHLSHRIVLASICLIILIGSFLSPVIKKQIVTATCWWLYIDHIWIIWIVNVNHFDIAYFSGLMTSFCALIITIRKPRLFFIFTISAVLITIFSSFLCQRPMLNIAMISFTMVILGIAFILTNLTLLSFQQKLLHRNSTLEIEVKKRADIAEKRANQLASKNKELEQFAYIASHDLKSPLRNISGFAQLLQRRLKDSQNKDINEYIDFIVGGVKRMNNIIEDILLYSRFGDEATKFKLEEINPILQEAFWALQWEIQEKHAIVYMDGIEGSMYCDRVQMVQLFQNLISNAVKYNTANRPLIKLCMTANINNYLFSVKDNGIGIPQEHQERVFKMFQRLHTDKEFSGTGIGLAICQRIVENHQGKIWMRSSEGSGTKFYFTISKTLDKAGELTSKKPSIEIEKISA